MPNETKPAVVIYDRVAALVLRDRCKEQLIRPELYAACEQTLKVLESRPAYIFCAFPRFNVIAGSRS